MMQGRSIVVPVYNQAATLRELLDGLAQGPPPNEERWTIIVVCNGCTDDSVSVALSFPQVVVDVLDTPSKAHALRRGDELADAAFPRLYVDADLRIDPASVAALFRMLESQKVLAVAPTTIWDTGGRSWLIRAYFYGITSLPRRAAWRNSHISGKGCYGLSAEGRGRFGPFPLLRADDAFVDAMFGPDERLVVGDAHAVATVPSSLRSLIRSIARTKGANRDLERIAAVRLFHGPRGEEKRSWAVRIRRTIKIWHASPLLRDRTPFRSAVAIVGFYLVLFASWLYRVITTTTGREAPWR